eukprot:4483430-Prymnesium_polylepis.1
MPEIGGRSCSATCSDHRNYSIDTMKSRSCETMRRGVSTPRTRTVPLLVTRCAPPIPCLARHEL